MIAIVFTGPAEARLEIEPRPAFHLLGNAFCGGGRVIGTYRNDRWHVDGVEYLSLEAYAQDLLLYFKSGALPSRTFGPFRHVVIENGAIRVADSSATLARCVTEANRVRWVAEDSSWSEVVLEATDRSLRK